MPLNILVPKETAANEQRIALVPSVLTKFPVGCKIYLQAGSGEKVGFADQQFVGAEIFTDLNIIRHANIILKVQAPTLKEIEYYPENSIVIGMLAIHKNSELIHTLAKKNITSFALELIPRITRAQSMDVLSSQAAAAGYKAVLIAANTIGRFFPMLTTAAGTIRPTTVLIIGAGVAGLQAIATAKRLGAIVEAYDIRPEAREQIESLGAKMVDLNIDARGSGGYARELTAEEKTKQQEILSKHIAKAEIVITTAAIPGKTAPRIINKNMLEQMKVGSVIVDIAAESGGNCELTKAGETISHNGILICGPVNLPSQLPRDASEMYARNIINFLQLLINKENTIEVNWQDEIVKACCVTHQGEKTL